jgi:ubiquinol-cytochrome c reductase cytochrome b subunit
MSGFYEWIDRRYPVTRFWNEHMAEYYAPKNFNFWYYFGSLALLMLVIQILTGIFLTMHYKPDANLAFASVEYIMRDVPWGWLIRYMHSTGASAFFIVVYLHMFRGLIYGSHREPRELLWLIGCVIFVALMAESFFGYLLPWGNMSYWGAQVIISLFDVIPWVGPMLTEWIRGDFVISDATLNRFFAFHVIALPLVLCLLVFMHLVALHRVGSGNPDGIEIKENKDENGIPVDGIGFHPYYTVKDIVGVVAFLILYVAVIFFMPEMGGVFLEKDNFTPANPLQTPVDIVPLWYFTPYYSILRANTISFFWIPAKFWGVFFMGWSIMILFLVPWLDRSPVKSIRYRSSPFKIALLLFVVAFLVLGYLGMRPVSPGRTIAAQVCTVLYFAFFFMMPFYTRWGTTKPVPDRVTFK